MTISNITSGSRISAKDLKEIEGRVKLKMIKAVRHLKHPNFDQGRKKPIFL